MALSRTTRLTETAADATNVTTSGTVTCETGDLLVVLIGQSRYFASDQPTAVSWNGVSLTKAFGIKGTDGASGWGAASIWYVIVETGATASLQITNSQITHFGICALTYTGYDAGTPIGDTDGTFQANSSGIPPSLTLTTAAGDEVVDVVAATSDGDGTITGGQTMLYDAEPDPGTHVQMSYKDAAGASTAVSWSIVLDRGYNYAAAVIKAAAGGGGGSALLPILLAH